jgi:hypothetical protein
MPGVYTDMALRMLKRAALMLARMAPKTRQAATLAITDAAGAMQGGAGYLHRFPRSALFPRLPPFGLMAAVVLMLVVVPQWLMTFPKMPLRETRVLLSGRSLYRPTEGPCYQALVLRIDGEQRWVFDDKPVSPEEFPGALKDALRRRADWVVYLDASPELQLRVPARAMDIMQGMFVKIVLMPRRTEQANRLLHQHD